MLELVVVLFILGLLAVSAMSLTGGLDRQVRLDSTRERLTMLRRALLGEVARLDGARRRVGGYVADVGVLAAWSRTIDQASSEEARRFAVRPAVFDPTPDAGDGLDDGSGDEIELDEPAERLGKGWRGPYVQPPPSAGASRYRDGWGNVDPDAGEDAANHGWSVAFDDPAARRSVTITSRGADGIADDAGGGDDDYEADVAMTIGEADWSVSLNGWSVRVVNQSGAPVSNLRAGLLVYRDGSWQRITTEQKATVEANASRALTFSFTADQIADGLDRAPIGEHLLVLIEDGDDVLGNGETPYPAPGTAGGARVTRRVTVLARMSLPEAELTITD